MKKTNVTNTNLAEYCGVSEGTIRYWEQNKVNLYDDAIKDYMASLNTTTKCDTKKKHILMVCGLKGGVGKSTISNILSYSVPNSAIFNIDITAKESHANSATTIDFSEIYKEDMENSKDDGCDIKASEVLNIVKEDYDTVFVDTPSDASEEFLDVAPYCDDFIVVFYDGRAIEASLGTVDVLFNLDVINKKKHRVFFIYNRAESQKDAEEALSEFKNGVEKIQKKSERGKDFECHYTYLENSKVVRTMEKQKISVVDLFTSKGIMYKSFRNRANRLINEADSFLELC